MKRIYCLLLLFLFLFLSSCNHAKKNNDDDEVQYWIYYLDNSESKVVRESYSPNATKTKDLIAELLEAMNQEPKNISYRKAKPDTVTVKGWKPVENGQLTINFDSNYNSMSKVKEILCRAAIVKTLCQINDVDFIQFYVEEQPLLDSNEKPIGYMTSENFIDNTGGETNYYQNANMVLFFANEKGDRLLETHITKQYDGTIPMEQLIIEQLIKGPSQIDGIKEDTFFPTIPDGTVLIKTTTKEGVCYVDFNEKFLEKRSGLTDFVALYSVVNSLVELSSVTKVQFSINGVQQKTYCEGTNFDGMFERNLDLVISQ